MSKEITYNENDLQEIENILREHGRNDLADKFEKFATDSSEVANRYNALHSTVKKAGLMKE